MGSCSYHARLMMLVGYIFLELKIDENSICDYVYILCLIRLITALGSFPLSISFEDY